SLRTHAAELIGSAPDLILANSTPALAAFRPENHSLPIVFVNVSDPIGQGFVPSLARPGGNLTGFTNFEFSIGSKWLQTLKEIAPGVGRGGVIFNRERAPFAPLFWQPIGAAGPLLAIEPIQSPVRDVAGIEGALAGLARAPGSGLIVLP